MDLSLLGLWHQMGNFAKGIVVVMAIMSIYSLTIMVSKWWSLRKAQKETHQVRARVLAVPRGRQPHRSHPPRRELQEVARRARARRRARRSEAADRRRLGHGVRHQLGGARGRAQHAPRDHEPEARPGGARDGRRHGAVRRTARHHDGHRERVHGHGRVGLRRSRRDRRSVSPRRSSRRRSVFSSPSRRCGRTTTSRPRSTTSRPR